MKRIGIRMSPLLGLALIASLSLSAPGAAASSPPKSKNFTLHPADVPGRMRHESATVTVIKTYTTTYSGTDPELARVFINESYILFLHHVNESYPNDTEGRISICSVLNTTSLKLDRTYANVNSPLNDTVFTWTRGTLKPKVGTSSELLLGTPQQGPWESGVNPRVDVYWSMKTASFYVVCDIADWSHVSSSSSTPIGPSQDVVDDAIRLARLVQSRVAAALEGT